MLEPLDAPQTNSLMRGLIGGTDLPEEARSRIAAVAEGNPLFVEETVRMLVDDGLLEHRQGRWALAGDLSSITIPPTIQALLTARLDRLEHEERGVIERAAAVGRSFWWGAVAELSPPELRSGIAASLQSLVRKQLIVPDRSDLPQEDAFRFTHILARDAAYQGIPKAVRAKMHERLAEWIELKTRDLAGEYEEIVGYHLERAHRSLVELGPPTDARKNAGSALRGSSVLRRRARVRARRHAGRGEPPLARDSPPARSRPAPPRTAPGTRVCVDGDGGLRSADGHCPGDGRRGDRNGGRRPARARDRPGPLDPSLHKSRGLGLRGPA